MIRRLLEKYRRPILFAVVGCINTLVDFGVFTFCAELLRFGAGASQTAGYLAGIACSFLLNRNVTFRDGRGSALYEALRYIVVNLLSLGVSTLLIWVFTNAGLNKYIAKIAVTVITMLINYFGYKIFVFRIKDNKEDQRDE